MKTKIKTIYAALSQIPVSGDAVDYMAVARSELRNLLREVSVAEKSPAKKEENDG